VSLNERKISTIGAEQL